MNEWIELYVAKTLDVRLMNITPWMRLFQWLNIEIGLRSKMVVWKTQMKEKNLGVADKLRNWYKDWSYSIKFNVLSLRAHKEKLLLNGIIWRNVYWYFCWWICRSWSFQFYESKYTRAPHESHRTASSVHTKTTNATYFFTLATRHFNCECAVLSFASYI